MRRWNPYALPYGTMVPTGLDDTEITKGVVGTGLARILGLCEALKLSDNKLRYLVRESIGRRGLSF